jgi:competence protein ComGC
MMRFSGVFFILFVLVVVIACNENKPVDEQEVIVIEKSAPAVDSVQLQVAAYELQLNEAEENIGKTIRQLNRLSAQLQDSIDGTQVPPQIQEETINNYRNKLYEVKQVQAALLQWQQRELPPSTDSLTSLQRKEYLESQLQQLEQLMQETRYVRQEANEAMQESDRVEY